MVHYNHILKHKHVGMKPVQKWYQSHDIEPREKPTYRHDQGLHTRRYLLRETPRRLLQWNNRKKTLSPKGKEMLMKEVEENKAYNTSRVSAKPKDHGKKIASSQKEKRARCYICKERGHVFWTCQNRKNIAMVKVQKETVEAINKNDAKKSNIQKRLLFKKLDYKFKMIGKEEVEKKFVFAYGIGDATVKGKDKDLVISNVQYTPEVSLNILSMDQLEEQGYIVKYNNNKCTLQYMFDEEMHGTGNSQRKGTKEEFIGPKDVIFEHNRFLDDYFMSIDPKDECSLVKGLEDLTLEKMPPVIGVMEINLLSLHKIVDSLGGYLRVTLEKTWYEVKPEKEVVKGSGTASVKDPQGKSKVHAGMKETLDEEMNKTQFGVRLESNDEEEAEEASST
nr:ARID DNA-binding domain-containing protein [Tanacetum cinerariifolium]